MACPSAAVDDRTRHVRTLAPDRFEHAIVLETDRNEVNPLLNVITHTPHEYVVTVMAFGSIDYRPE